MPIDDVNTEWLRRFRRNLTRWYAKHARQFPWRETRDPYHIWISEIMLQQTTVAAVAPYFERFIKQFPTLSSLASADEHDVLRQWEGLGYYSRARNLHRAAQQLVADHGGEFPRTADELQLLPGIGRYTAGAIASFAFDSRAPIVEANTLRLYCRLLGFQGDPRSAAGTRLWWEFAEKVLPRKNVGQFNQALMELGGTLCAISDPSCSKCPVRSSCDAFAQNSQKEIPRPAIRPQTTRTVEMTVAVRKGQKYLLRQRLEGERWAGLWDFPRFPVEADVELFHTRPKKTKSKQFDRTIGMIASSLERVIEENFGIQTDCGPLLKIIRHGVTRYRIALLCFSAEHGQGNVSSKQDQFRWLAPAEFSTYPLSVTGRQFAALIQEQSAVDGI